MQVISVDVGTRNGDGKRDVIFRFGDKEYPDRLDVGNGFQREQAIGRAVAFFGLKKQHADKLGTDLVRLAKEKDQDAADNEIVGRPFIRRVDTVVKEILCWLWFGYFAVGKLNLLNGDPGLGKSLALLDIIARVTTGRKWPDGTPNNNAGRALLISFEDDLADTIRPRLEAAEADLSRVDFLQGIRGYNPDGNENVRPFDLRRDILSLDEAISDDCKIIGIDPLSACMGETDTHKNAEVRAALMPLIELAQRRGVAIVGVSHLNKSGGGNAIYRTSGSLAFVAAARSVWLVIKDKENPRKRLFLPAKNNLAADTNGLSYQIMDQDGQPVLAWSREPIMMTADEALTPEPKRASKGMREAKQGEAEQWLRAYLSGGAKSSDEVNTAATKAGYSRRMLWNAKDAIDVLPYREGFGRDGTWYWRLPAIDSQFSADSQIDME
jgi:putative DNA primase/helicase